MEKDGCQVEDDKGATEEETKKWAKGRSGENVEKVNDAA